jgi:hypothetical protein
METATATLTTDTLEQQLLNAESTIARMRAAQMTIIGEIDRRQVPLSDGCRSLAEWVAGRLDVAPETAKALVSTSRRLEVDLVRPHDSGCTHRGPVRRRNDHR